jgi:hypothetical protein
MHTTAGKTPSFEEFAGETTILPYRRLSQSQFDNYPIKLFGI